MLDKEVAEERAEIAEAELEEVKERLAVLEVEIGVLREGGGMYLFSLRIVHLMEMLFQAARRKGKAMARTLWPIYN